MSIDKDKIKIVCVSNNKKTLEDVILSNPNMNQYLITAYDNVNENIGISKRYNDFIEKNIDKKSDFWVVFCHQDFGFEENIYKKITKLNKNNIYGPIGVRIFVSLKRFLKSLIAKKLGYYPSIKINLKGFLKKETKLIYLEKDESKTNIDYLKRKFLGQIKQGQNNSDFKKLGKKLFVQKEVANLDCCCMIVHSSLINKFDLKFDENLDWHMYVEDFCMTAKEKYNIKSKVVQFKCFHLGIGDYNEGFFETAKYIKEKYSLTHLKTTCIDD